ncbi:MULTISPECIES: diguanylate cyclase [unclassified Chelatococcus]|uniref:diguanylate cyclase domain-containing protein n=1 Tax=unclassified Chelatococcus TaxID=2638111 RepID=UPI001BCAF606|nr:MULTISPECIES: diguanylate cyclase [unclassified Chelatococcus]MBS7742562.1 diguanylate cyclase [Chelatococcus sp. HY11]MBX3542320.1 diguanylate cyclase [Chelatococcus sp.]MCO5075462.1 diguanylate cyclase [Chelatococcus sp.]
MDFAERDGMEPSLGCDVRVGLGEPQHSDNPLQTNIRSDSCDLRFDAICRLARALLSAPVAIVHLRGTPTRWTDFAPEARSWRWLQTVPLEPPADVVENPWLIGDTLDLGNAGLGWLDVTPQVRFVAGVAFGPEGEGLLSLFDIHPRGFCGKEARHLRDLSVIAGENLELRRKAQTESQQAADFRLLAESSTDTIVRGTPDGVRRYISPSVRALLGYEPEELVGRRAIEIVHPDDEPRFNNLMQRLHRGEFEIAEIEIRQRHKDGSWIWMEAAIRLTREPLTGELTGYVASVRGIERRKELETRLEYLASHDTLTGLPNRAVFDQHLAEAIAKYSLSGQGFALLYLDLDHFKRINDTCGHPAGDAVLRAVAQRLRSALRPRDVVVRIGGDEFIILLEGSAEPGDIAVIATRLISRLDEPVAHGQQKLTVGVSMGIACAPECGIEPDGLIAAADRALYAAKQSGRGCFRLARTK